MFVLENKFESDDIVVVPPHVFLGDSGGERGNCVELIEDDPGSPVALEFCALLTSALAPYPCNAEKSLQ